MKDNPFSPVEKVFSVIAPCYKDAYKTFPKFFQNLNEQDYKAFEVIVVFDGKNSKGLKALEAMRTKYPDMKIIDKTVTHGGAPWARNQGAKLATGDYLTFLDPDVYLYSETLRIWANELEARPDKDVVWGLYDIEIDGNIYPIGGSVPCKPDGQPDYWAFRFSNYCSGAFPQRKEAFLGWDETVKSLQDWDMWVRTLKQDNFEGKKFHFMPRSFFITENVRQGGISDDSHRNWIERLRYVKEKNGIPFSPICVTSLGAPFHGLHVAKKLGADYLPMPSFKPHNYKVIYLLGFYPDNARDHGQIFEGDGERAKKIIHWIGTDTWKMWWKIPFGAVKAMREHWKNEKFVHLTECDHMHKEMSELGIDSKIIPIPPQKLYEPIPLPEKFTVGIYENKTQNMYREELMQEVARSMPDVEFYFFGNEEKKGEQHENVTHLGWIDLDEWLPKLSCNLRVTIHDGLPITPLQFLTAGRNVITNTDLKHAIKASADRKSIIEAIRKAQANPLKKQASDYWKKELDFKKYHRSIWRYV